MCYVYHMHTHARTIILKITKKKKRIEAFRAGLDSRHLQFQPLRGWAGRTVSLKLVWGILSINEKQNKKQTKPPYTLGRY